jgi:hypothetical protein
MPKSKLLNSNLYLVTYLCFFLLELAYIFVILSSYGKDGRFNSLYFKIKLNLNYFLVFGFVFLTFFTMIFPGIGWLAFMITLYKIADMCCKQKEMFEQELYYGWGRYYPESATIYNEAELERENDGTSAAYSSAERDVEDKYWLSKLYPIRKLFKNELEIEPQPFIYNECRGDIETYGSIFESLNTPRPLFTTSTLAKEMKVA